MWLSGKRGGQTTGMLLGEHHYLLQYRALPLLPQIKQATSHGQMVVRTSKSDCLITMTFDF